MSYLLSITILQQLILLINSYIITHPFRVVVFRTRHSMYTLASFPPHSPTYTVSRLEFITLRGGEASLLTTPLIPTTNIRRIYHSKIW